MLFDFTTFIKLFKKGDYEIIGQAYPITAITGFLAYFIFYLTDKSLGLHENFLIRLFIAILFIQLIFFKSNFNAIKIFAIESILAICLPLFYSYFYFANNTNILWSSGIIFCSFTYGFMTGKFIHTITIYPLFVITGFFLYGYICRETTMYLFLNGMTIILLSIIIASLASIFKLVVDCTLLASIDNVDLQKRVVKENAVKGSADYNRGLEKDLNKVKKLSTVSKLAGGLVTDFGEMIKIISRESNELRRLYISDISKIKRIDTVLDVIKKASALINNFAAFTPETSSSYCLINIHDIMNSTIRLLSETVKKNILIKTEFSARNSIIFGNAEMLEQAFVNICINAFHAMPQGGGLVITTEDRLHTSEEYVNKHNSENIVICFNDTGTGMDQKTIENVFKPFFSTKSEDMGSGLGLVMVNETIKRHNGSITVKSTLSKGTTFRIVLPVKVS
jgi:signal transduction histidine kinase